MGTIIDGLENDTSEEYEVSDYEIYVDIRLEANDPIHLSTVRLIDDTDDADLPEYTTYIEADSEDVLGLDEVR